MSTVHPMTAAPSTQATLMFMSSTMSLAVSVSRSTILSMRKRARNISAMPSTWYARNVAMYMPIPSSCARATQTRSAHVRSSELAGMQDLHVRAIQAACGDDAKAEDKTGEGDAEGLVVSLSQLGCELEWRFRAPPARATTRTRQVSPGECRGAGRGGGVITGANGRNRRTSSVRPRATGPQ